MSGTRVLCNFDTITDGKKETKVAKATADIAQKLLDLVDPVPLHRMGSRVFTVTNSPNEGPLIRFLTRVDDLFGWLASRNIHVTWSDSPGLLRKTEFLSYLGLVLENYEITAQMPHVPPLTNAYYYGIAPEAKPSPYFDELVNLWKPATEHDRVLIKAAFCTPFWGGEPGRRPAFFIENDGQDNGRGIGKSILMMAIAEIAGGRIDVAQKDNINSLKTRILSSSDTRVITIDNLKAERFSSAEIEGLITANTISGHRLYTGEGNVPNNFTFVFTMNDVNLSSDLSQRAIRIRLARAPKTPDWLQRFDRLIKNHREEIIGAILYTLAQPEQTSSITMRFADWQRCVLSKVSDTPTEIAEAVLARQDEVDADADDAHAIMELFDFKIRQYRHEFGQRVREADPDHFNYFILRQVAAKWMSEGVGRMSPNAASRRIARAKIARISTFESDGNRYWFVAKPGSSPSPDLSGYVINLERPDIIPFKKVERRCANLTLAPGG